MINETISFLDEVFLIPESNSIRKASDWIANLCALNEVPNDVINRLLICLNEALANILEHGGPSVFLSKIHVKFDFTIIDKLGKVTLTVTDSGITFNPIYSHEIKCPVSLDIAEPGGLGLIMLNKFSDQISHKYVDGFNILSFSVHYKC